MIAHGMPGTPRSHDFTSVPVARSLTSRFLGLLGRRDPDRLFLLIPHCSTVHTFFMRSRIDIVFLDAECRVTNIEPDARPWRIYSSRQPTHAVLELPPGTVRRRGIARDDRMVLQFRSQP
jgi:uncharacterized membrane protein (UPF0127 family)